MLKQVTCKLQSEDKNHTQEYRQSGMHVYTYRDTSLHTHAILHAHAQLEIDTCEWAALLVQYPQGIYKLKTPNAQ